MIAPTAWRASTRHLLHHPWQLVLVVIGIALGVAVVVAVDLANSSARRAFELSMEALSGPATHQIIGGPSGLDERLYVRLRTHGIRAVAPVVEGYGEARGITVHLVGIDPFAVAGRPGGVAVHSGAAVRALLTEPGAVLMSAQTAQALGVATGERFKLLLRGRARAVVQAGTLDVANAAALQNVLVADIATAQSMLGTLGRLSWIDVTAPAGPAGTALRERIEKLLPGDAVLVPARSRTAALERMAGAFRINLTAMSLLALVVGMFLIYNTITFAVLQRRALLGRLRALGVTRAEVFWLILVEALGLGVLGTVLGLLLGVVIAGALVHLVARTLNDLYFAVTVGTLHVAAAPMLKAVALGLGAALLATLAPAAEAAWTPPQGVLSRSVLEARAHRLAPRLAVAGVALLLACAFMLLLPGRSLVAGFAALFALLVGLSLLTPAVVLGAVWLGTPVVRLCSVQIRLAVHGIAGSLSRTGVAIAALMLAVATTVGVGIMVESFRATVVSWLDTTLQADLYIAAPSLMSSRTEVPIDPALVAAVRTVPGVAEVTTTNATTIESSQGLTEVRAVELAAGRALRFRLRGGDPGRVWPLFRAGAEVLVSEPYAQLHDVRAGDRVVLRTDSGIQQFKVGGVFYDYVSGPGTVLMSRALFERHWHERGATAIGVYLDPAADEDAVRARLRSVLAAQPGLMLRSQRAVREGSLAIFDRTFVITNVLRLLAVLVAFVGVLSALMAVQFERAREVAILRATGLTPAQVWAHLLSQSGLMGLAAGLVAIPVGVLLALMLIHVINRRAFGWSMQTLVSPELALQALLLAVVAALLAGLYPAWRMSRQNPAQALREE